MHNLQNGDKLVDFYLDRDEFENAFLVSIVNSRKELEPAAVPPASPSRRVSEAKEMSEHKTPEPIVVNSSMVSFVSYKFDFWL
jgi:hypothetical protein